MPGSVHGADKSAVANAMADNGAKLDMPNGAHEQVPPPPRAGLDVQSLTPLEG